MLSVRTRLFQSASNTEGGVKIALTLEQIKELLSREQTKPKTKRKSKSGIDTSDRSIVTWFKLASSLYDEDTGELTRCSNPNCPDTRNKQMVSLVDGVKMCRRCFLAGYASEIEGQVNMLDD